MDCKHLQEEYAEAHLAVTRTNVECQEMRERHEAEERETYGRHFATQKTLEDMRGRIINEALT
jgi:hypothetical protein